MKERDPIPMILTGVASIVGTIGVLWYYGYLHFAKPEDALLLSEFTMLKTIPGRITRCRSSLPTRWRSVSMACWCCSTPSRRG